MKRIVFILLFTASSGSLFSQDILQSGSDTSAAAQQYTYAYITVSEKVLSSKLKVTIDLGSKPEQIKLANEYWSQIKDEKSYAAVLNYMTENGFVLVETLDYSNGYNNNGETSGVRFIMKKIVNK